MIAHRFLGILTFISLVTSLPVAGADSSFESLLRVHKGSASRTVALSFELNRGQAAPQVKFLGRGTGRGYFLGSGEIILSGTVKMRFKNANRALRLDAENPLPGRSHYLIGGDAAKWTTDVVTYEKVRYTGVYPGIDAVFHGSQGDLEHDFVVAPGADPSRIRLEFSGARRLSVDHDGDLLIETNGGVIRQRKPAIYQELSESKIAGGFVLKGKREVGFEVGPYDASQALVIDPVILFSGGFGGSGSEDAFGVALDDSGNSYVTGMTNSTNFPSTGPVQGTYGGGVSDVFVTKFGPDGKVIYSTYIGGTDDDEGLGIKVDDQGNAYVTGFTKSQNFPRVGSFSRGPGGLTDGFLLKLDPTGSKLVFSTNLGGSGDDAAQRIALDSAGNAYLAGFTRSTNFPTQSPYQGALKGGFDAFISKLSPAGQILYSTYLGGSQDDAANSLVVDESGQVFATGFTQSRDFPATKGAYKGGADVFVVRLDTSGKLVDGAFFGGSGDDIGNAIAVGYLDNVTVIGSTTSVDLPVTADATQKTLQPGGPNGFVVHFDPQPATSAAGAVVATRFVADAPPSGPQLNQPNSSTYTPKPGVAVAKSLSLHDVVTGVRAVGLYEFHVSSGDFGDCKGILIRANFAPESVQFGLGQSLASVFGFVPAPGTFCITAQELNDLDAVLSKIMKAFDLTAIGATDLLGLTTPPKSMPESLLPRAVGPTHAFVNRVEFQTEPMIYFSGVVSAASFQPGPIAPGEVVTIFGNNLGPATLVGASLNNAGLVDTTSGGTMVLFDGVPAPMVYSRADVVCAIVPYSVAGKTQTTVLLANNKTLSVTAAVLPVAPSAPAIFTAGSGTGPAALFNADSSANSPSNPADKDSIITFYATGEGQTTPEGVDGKPTGNPAPKPALPLSVSIGGLNADVIYYGGVPTVVAGVLQVNARVPAGAPSGAAVPVILKVGSASSQSGVTMSIR